MNDRPVKVQARELRIGDLLVGTRTSPPELGKPVTETTREGKTRVSARVDGEDTPRTYTAKQELFIYREAH